VADSATGRELRAKALFAAGWIALNVLRDTSAAGRFFDTLIAGYPADEHSKRAQTELGRAVTVQTREDSAHAAYLAAEELCFQRDEPVKGVEAWLRAYSSFPDSREAARSLYAAAWVCDNVTFRKDAAQFLYRKLCDRFPDSSYCSQAAKPRLRMALDTSAVRNAAAPQPKAPAAKPPAQ